MISGAGEKEAKFWLGSIWPLAEPPCYLSPHQVTLSPIPKQLPNEARFPTDLNYKASNVSPRGVTLQERTAQTSFWMSSNWSSL